MGRRKRTETITTRLEREYRLFNGDCIEGMNRQLNAKSISVVVTSPPYNLGISYNEYDDTIPRNEYLDWLEKWAIQVKDVLADDGSLFLNLGSKPSDPWGPLEVALKLKKHLHLQNVFHWIKSIYIEEDSYQQPIKINVGHFKPINSKRYVNDLHEYIFHFTKVGDVELDRLAIGVPYKDKSNVTRWKKAGKGVRCRGNVWYMPYETILSRDRERPHPATFPPQLAELCVKLHGLERVSTVMDPFLGLGNSAMGCLALPVDFVGFELDDYYFQEAVQKLSSESQSFFLTE